MKEKNLFDILGNAEDDSMERLTDKCPEITDAQLDKILAMSEKKYRMKKKEIERTKKDKHITMTENDTVEGVEHSKRPVWFTSLCTAASLVLVAGIAIGSTMLLRSGKGGIRHGGVENPAVTATTSEGTGTTLVTTSVSSTTGKNGSTDKNGSTITTVVTVVSDVKDTNKQQTDSSKAVSGGDNTANGGNTSDSMSVKPYVGQWKYEVSADSQYTVDVRPKDNGTVVIKEDGTYTYTDANGYTSSGTVKVGYEEMGGSKTTTVSFMDGSTHKFGGYYLPSRPDEIHLGNGGIARLIRGKEAIECSEYRNIALDLVERSYDMTQIFMYRFNQYTNLNDTVTFNIVNPYTGGQLENVTFARISGKGLEINSMDDIEAYERTVKTERLINMFPREKCVTISSSYNNGDHIDESGTDHEELLYYQSFIMYKGNLYANTVMPQESWIGHTAPREPIVITDVTSNSFRAYYPCIMGENKYGCDIIDFVIDPTFGEWRINEMASDAYSLYQSEAANLQY